MLLFKAGVTVREQSRTQSPQAPWSAAWSPGETLGKWNFFNFFDWLFG